MSQQQPQQCTHQQQHCCVVGGGGISLFFAPGPLVAAACLSGLVTLLEFSVRSYLVGNAGSRPISEAKQPWACLVLRWGTTGEAHVLYSLPKLLPSQKLRRAVLYLPCAPPLSSVFPSAIWTPPLLLVLLLLLLSPQFSPPSPSLPPSLPAPAICTLPSRNSPR